MKIVSKNVERFRGTTEGDRWENAARLIRGVDHATWCQSKYKDPCNCGLVEVTDL